MGTLAVDKLLKTSTGAAEFTLPATDGTAGQVWQTDGAGQLSVAALAADTVTATQIAADAVGSSEIAANAVGNSEMADDAFGVAELSATGTASATTFLRGDNSWSASSGTIVKRAVICEQQASGVAGGTATSGSFQIRVLNTEIYDDIGISIATNVFTLPAGTFYIHWAAPARGVNSHMSRLYDVTNSAVVEYGSTALDAAAPYDNQNTSIGYAKVTPSVATGYRIEHQVYTTVASYGWGYPASYSVEKYTIVEIEQHS